MTPSSCTYAQLDTPVPMELRDVFGTGRHPLTEHRRAGRPFSAVPARHLGISTSPRRWDSARWPRCRTRRSWRWPPSRLAAWPPRRASSSSSTGELDRREGWREEGATSLESWMVERLGVSVPTARAFAHVGERLFDLPHLAAGLSSGDLSFDKVRAVVDGATPGIRRRAPGPGHGALGTRAGPAGPIPPACLDRHRSRRPREPIPALQRVLPDASPPNSRPRRSPRYGARSRPRPASFPPTVETPWDQRLCDTFVDIVRSSRQPGPYGYAVHRRRPRATRDVARRDRRSSLASSSATGSSAATPFAGWPVTATIILASMTKTATRCTRAGNAAFPPRRNVARLMRRDRHCRFPGCANATFVNAHHIRWWKPHRGHHRLAQSGPALRTPPPSGALEAVERVRQCQRGAHVRYPTGRVMTSRPSPLWTTVSRGTLPRDGSSGAG